ncbi:MAG: MGMT family protein [bacterium]
MDAFHETILRIVRSIPHGSVASYGQVAEYAGAPKATRETGWAMHALGGTPDFPWWRVLSSAGRISLQENSGTSPQAQQKLLEDEGIEFAAPLALDIERYRYRADTTALKAFGLSPERAGALSEKYRANQLPLL